MKKRNIPFGYQYQNGVITTHPQEATVLKRIFSDYLKGLSLLDIATQLNAENVEYQPGITGWNKSRIMRLIADIRYYTEKIRSEPKWAFEGIFADRGLSGISTKKRDEFNKMIKQCKRGKIDMIITKSISRFARNTADVLKYVRTLKESGVDIFFEEQNIHSTQPGVEFYIKTITLPLSTLPLSPECRKNWPGAQASGRSSKKAPRPSRAGTPANMP